MVFVCVHVGAVVCVRGVFAGRVIWLLICRREQGNSLELPPAISSSFSLFALPLDGMGTSGLQVLPSSVVMWKTQSCRSTGGEDLM